VRHNQKMLQVVKTDDPPVETKSAGEVLDEVVAVLADGIRCVSPADPAAGHLRDLHDLLAARRLGAVWQ